MFVLACIDYLLQLSKLLQNFAALNNKRLLCQTTLGDAGIGEQLTEMVVVLGSLM